MSQEIVYTSAPKGLKPGSRGFCTVVSTEGMAGNLADRLESHSGYRHAFGVNDERRESNPVNWSHTTMRIGGAQFHVLSRVSDAGLDYSGRSNKLAHHIALEVSELPMAGPARTLMTTGVIRSDWSGEVGLVARRKLPDVPIPRSYRATSWRRVMGDPAWAGLVAEKLLASNLPLSLIFPLGTDAMALLIEVLDLLPLKQRWSISFSTYFTQLAPGTECRLRFVLDDTPEAAALRKNPHAAVIDLVRKQDAETGGELAACARSDQLPTHSLPLEPTAPTQKPSKAPDKPTARRELPTVPADDVYDAEWDESEADAGDEYELQQPERSRQPETNESRRARRQRAEEMPVHRPLQLRTVWIASGVTVGLTLFICVFALVLQRIRGQAPDPASASPIIAQQPTPPAPTQKNPEPSIAKAGKPGVIPALLPGGAGRPIPSDAHKSATDQIAAGQPPHPQLPANNPTPKPAEPSPDIPKPAPLKSTPDPFAKLPRDAKDKRLAVLKLPSPTELKPLEWEFATGNSDQLKIELLGGEKLLGKNVGTFELIPKSDEKRATDLAWVLRIKDPLGAEPLLGEFRMIQDKELTHLWFSWLPTAATTQGVELVPWLTLGLTAGDKKMLCRLSEMQPISRLPCKFQEDKYVSIPSFDFKSPLLGDRLVGGGSLFVMGISLPPELCNGKKFDFGSLARMPVDSKKTFEIPLAISPDEDDTADFKLFDDDDAPLAFIKIEPNVDSKRLSLEITASARVVIYDRSKFTEIHKSATELDGMFIAPKPITSGLSASAPIGGKLNDGAAKQLSKLIQTTIDELKMLGVSRDSKIDMFKAKRDAAIMPDDKERFQKQIDSLSRDQMKLQKVVASFETQLKRHDVPPFRTLRKLLLGDKRPEDEENSLRGIINNAKIGVTIGYEQTFGGETYLIVVEEASK